jgi:hypothetical protein
MYRLAAFVGGSSFYYVGISVIFTYNFQDFLQALWGHAVAVPEVTTFSFVIPSGSLLTSDLLVLC